MSKPRNSVILEIYKRPETVFSFQKLSQIFRDKDEVSLRNLLSYYVKAGKILRPRRGFYAKEGYSSRELANKIYKPSYISFTTVLRDAGMVFQHSNSIYSASYLSRDIDDLNFVYHKIKDSILFNTQGIVKKDYVNMATKERAFLDLLYLVGDFYIDNLEPLNWDIVFDLLSIYNQVTLGKRVEKQYKIYKQEYVRTK